MVRWLDPHQLVDTAVRVLLSGIFSAYADNRELQALVAADVPDRSEEPELWFDYVADLGDGWNSTYTVARLLASEQLELDWDGEAHATERGRILVMGGDQVYPVPKAGEYENRMLGPYQAALPCVPGPAPELFAIPGSHDWYDGLVNFTSIFCRGGSIGGWVTRQRRSYFAVKLPNGWWLWGIDIQFGAYIDEAQLEYFADLTADQVQPGDRIILCMAKEVESGRKQSEIHSDRDVEYLERKVVDPSGARVQVYLKSGKHHYARYQEEGGSRQHIASGGGGAFLHPTHDLPGRLDLAGAEGAVPYRRVGTYPSPTVSKRLRKRIWLLAAYNIPLAGVFGTVQLLLAFMLGLHLRGRHVALGLGGLRQAVWASPTAFLLILLMVVSLAAMVRFAHDARGLGRLLLGLVHSTMQLASVAGVMIAASRLSSVNGLRGGVVPARLPRPGRRAGRDRGNGGDVGLPVGHQLPRLPRERGVCTPAPPGSQTLPPPAHRHRRGVDGVPDRRRPGGPQMGAVPGRPCPLPLVRPRGPRARTAPDRGAVHPLAPRPPVEGSGPPPR